MDVKCVLPPACLLLWAGRNKDQPRFFDCPSYLSFDDEVYRCDILTLFLDVGEVVFVTNLQHHHKRLRIEHRIRMRELKFSHD